MRIIGIDPGIATTGYSILENVNGEIRLLDYGCIKTKSGLPSNVRLEQLAEDLQTLIKKWKPQFSAIEKLFFQNNIKTAMIVSEARGVIIQTLGHHEVEINEFTPLEVKSAICGYGKADKKMVQQMVKIILGLKNAPRPDDAADAIAIAICLANSLALKQAISVQ
ncbi:MAG: crossover junction endodeoxyribonuclease RuvC [Patescibacteria group bacterium]